MGRPAGRFLAARSPIGHITRGASDYRGVFGLLPTPYREDLEIHLEDLRRGADFCCQTGQHGIVWPVMVGEFWFLGESERLRALAAVLEEVNGRLPVIFGCSGISIPQVVLYAQAAARAGADAVIAMAPAHTDQSGAIALYHRIAEVFDGPIVVQNSDRYAPLTAEQIAALVDELPQVRCVKEEREPGPKHIAEVAHIFGDRVACIFGGAGGKYLPDELRRGAGGNMPACELADLLAKVVERWWSGDEQGAQALHRRLLPLINLESHPFMRYILQRRGVFTTLVERAPAGKLALDEADKAEIDILLRAVEDDIEAFPIRPRRA